MSSKRDASGATPDRFRRTSVLVGGFAIFMAVLGVLNVTVEFIGGAIWTLVAFGGAALGLAAARDLRRLARKIEKRGEETADPA